MSGGRRWLVLVPVNVAAETGDAHSLSIRFRRWLASPDAADARFAALFRAFAERTGDAEAQAIVRVTDGVRS